MEKLDSAGISENVGRCVSEQCQSTPSECSWACSYSLQWNAKDDWNHGLNEKLVLILVMQVNILTAYGKSETFVVQDGVATGLPKSTTKGWILACISGTVGFCHAFPGK